MHFSHFQGINRAPCCAFAVLPLSPHPMPSSQTSWFTVDFWHVSEAKRTISCQLHLWKLLNTIFLAWEMLLWPFQASLLWCLRTWLQAVKPLWSVSQGGNCYRKLSWARTSISGTASPTDCPAQKVRKIGHLAKDPTRTVCVCACICLYLYFPEQPADIWHRGWEWKSLGTGQLSWGRVYAFLFWDFFCGFFLPLSLNTSESPRRNTKTELYLPHWMDSQKMSLLSIFRLWPCKVCLPNGLTLGESIWTWMCRSALDTGCGHPWKGKAAGTLSLWKRGDRVAEGAVQKGKGLNWVTLCAWMMGKVRRGQGYLKDGLAGKQKSAGDCPISLGVAAGKLIIQLPLPYPSLQVAPFEGPCSCCCSST